jgi:cell division protein FtsI/penicillin-binding protein 2
MTFNEDLKPVRLSLDLRVQHVLRDELAAAIDRYKAIAAAGVVLNIHTGEVLGMSSLPDYDPNNPVEALEKDRLNRMSAGTYEMGSTFKAFTTAMALDSGKVKITDSFDARGSIRIGGFTISDFHGKNRVLTVPEIFIYSSNIGTARMADLVGIEGHKEFLTRLGLSDPDADRIAGGGDAAPAGGVEEDQLDHDLLWPWGLDHAAADRGGRGSADEWRQADRADIPAAGRARPQQPCGSGA